MNTFLIRGHIKYIFAGMACAAPYITHHIFLNKSSLFYMSKFVTVLLYYQALVMLDIFLLLSVAFLGQGPFEKETIVSI